MKKHFKLSFFSLSAMVILLLSAIGSFAQTTNDPNNDPDSNACYEGGTLYDTCNSMDADHDGDIDQQDSDWMWKCGYFLIRVEYGIYSSDMLTDGTCSTVVEEVQVVIEKEEKKKKKSDCERPQAPAAAAIPCDL